MLILYSCGQLHSVLCIHFPVDRPEALACVYVTKSPSPAVCVTFNQPVKVHVHVHIKHGCHTHNVIVITYMNGHTKTWQKSSCLMQEFPVYRVADGHKSS